MPGIRRQISRRCNIMREKEEKHSASREEKERILSGLIGQG